VQLTGRPELNHGCPLEIFASPAADNAVNLNASHFRCAA
jgi:hypothetical protein